MSATGLPDAVRRALQEQHDYEQARATRLGRGAERLTAPLGGMIARSLPPNAVRRALVMADQAAAALPSERPRHDPANLPACDAAALEVQGWAQGMNAASGGMAGILGAAGMTADIPATLVLAARNVRGTGVAYGFDGLEPAERGYRLMVLEVATGQAGPRRQETLERLNTLAHQLATPEGRMALDRAGDWVAEKVVERVARTLGVSLAGRKAGQVVPIIGGAIAATVNASFQVDVARAARYAYRQRWLMARNLLPVAEPEADHAPEPEPEPEAEAD